MSPEDDVHSTYDDLRKLLVETKFAWVIDNVDVKLRNGIPQDYNVPRYRESLEEDTANKARRERKETVTGIRPYDEKEMLSLLIDEIERCIIVPLQIADALPKTLSTSTTPLDGIEIVDNETGKTAFRVTPGQPVGGELVVTLADAIRRLRKGL
jgi:hypothetical protein